MTIDPQRPRATVRRLGVLSILLTSSILPLGGGPAATEVASAETRRANRLAGESSPYLLLHQYNPVDWYPWGEEALAKARNENKPIFLSVGYATCYWCHVMERESFDDPKIAAILNERFVPIKVDREERPDLDEIYMTATQLITRRGGWPNSVFLTPELVPFFAGTYFPPDDRGGRPGFESLLRALSGAWRERRSEIDAQSRAIGDAMRQVLEQRAAPAAAPVGPEEVDAAVAGLVASFDATHGGFGSAPKFPTPANLFLLLERLDGRADLEPVVRQTLDRMARGGIYDQIGGGFHRYATDAAWNVPHFEKMLYDNGLLLEVYARWYERTGDAQAARIVRETVGWLRREMTGPEGAYWSAIDAETDAREGAFYVWTRTELDEVLGGDAAFLAPLLGFSGAPFFEQHEYVLHLPEPIADAAKARGQTADELWRRIGPLRAHLLARRDRRERPLTDDKIQTDWNGMAIAGVATAGRLLDEPSMVADAARAADFVLRTLAPRGRTMQHTWRGGVAKVDAFLDDYAYLLRGLLALDLATDDPRWLRAATRIAAQLLDRLEDPEHGAFFASVARPDLLFRTKPTTDGAIPAGNAVAVEALLALSERTGETRWKRAAERTLRALAPMQQAAPAAYRGLALAAHRYRASTGTGKPAAPGDARPPTATDALRREAERAVAVTGRWTATPARADDPGRSFEVVLEIAEGWHVNANPASDRFLIATEVLTAPGAEHGSITTHYPAGETLAVRYAQKPIAVYRGRAAITGTLQGDDRLRVTYQACDDQRCLQPVVQVLTLADVP